MGFWRLNNYIAKGNTEALQRPFHTFHYLKKKSLFLRIIFQASLVSFVYSFEDVCIVIKYLMLSFALTLKLKNNTTISQ